MCFISITDLQCKGISVNTEMGKIIQLKFLWPYVTSNSLSPSTSILFRRQHLSCLTFDHRYISLHETFSPFFFKIGFSLLRSLTQKKYYLVTISNGYWKWNRFIHNKFWLIFIRTLHKFNPIQTHQSYCRRQLNVHNIS